MKPIIFALVAVVLYAIQNVLIDIKLRQYSTISLLLGFYAVLLPLGLGMFVILKILGQPVVVPTGDGFKVVALVAAAFFVADFFMWGLTRAGVM